MNVQAPPTHNPQGSRSPLPLPAASPDQEGSPRVEVASAVLSLSIPSESAMPSDQKLYSQRALDRHQITVTEALSSLGALWSGCKGCFSNVGMVLFPKLYILPRWVPVVPIATSCYFGPVKATFGLVVVGGVAGGLGLASGWFGKARELYNVSPHENLSKSKQDLFQSWGWRAEGLVKYKIERFNAEANWLQSAPEDMALGDPEQLLLGNQNNLIVPAREASMRRVVSLCQQEVDSQKDKVQKLSKELEQLSEGQSYDQKCQIESCRLTKLIEEALLKYFEASLKRAQSELASDSVKTEEAAELSTEEHHISRQELKKKLSPIYEKYSSGDRNFKQDEHYIRGIQRELAEAIVDTDYMTWATEQEMTTKINWQTAEEEAKRLRNSSSS